MLFSLTISLLRRLLSKKKIIVVSYAVDCFNYITNRRFGWTFILNYDH
jgi:hypothetical protein